MIDTIYLLLPGLSVSLSLTFISLGIAFVLALILTSLLTLNIPIFTPIIRSYITLFTGTPLLVQFFLIYFGSTQFAFLQNIASLSNPWVCSIIALSLNSTAYSTLLFHGALKAIPVGQWESCSSLGMSTGQTLRTLLPYAIKRALSAYSNEVVLIFKGTSLASTITLMDIMGYSRQLFGETYDMNAFLAAGVLYLIVTGILTVIMRFIEKKALIFEQPT